MGSWVRPVSLRETPSGCCLSLGGLGLGHGHGAMARPGLEPGTPRFSVVAGRSRQGIDGPASPAWSAIVSGGSVARLAGTRRARDAFGTLLLGRLVPRRRRGRALLGRVWATGRRGQLSLGVRIICAERGECH